MGENLAKWLLENELSTPPASLLPPKSLPPPGPSRLAGGGFGRSGGRLVGSCIQGRDPPAGREPDFANGTFSKILTTVMRASTLDHEKGFASAASTMNKTKLLSLFFVAIFGIVLRVHAQAVPLFVPGETYRVAINRSDTVPDAQFTRTLAGQLNGDLDPDVVFLRGDFPHLAVSPAVYDSVVRYPEPANDIAILRSPALTRDELLTVSGIGLVAWARTENQGFTSRALGSDLWNGAKILRSGRSELRPAPLVVGVAANGTDLLLMTNPGTPEENETSFPLDGNAIDVILYDRNEDDLADLAVLTDTGLHLYDSGSQVPIASFASNAPQGRLAKIGDARSSSRDLIWIETQPGIVDTLFKIRGTNLSSPMPLGPLSTVAVVAGDVDRNGADDLLISHQASYELILLLNHNGTFSIGSDTAVTVSTGPTGPASNNHAWPVILDLEKDRDLDVVFPVQSTQEFFVFSNRIVNHQAQAPRLLETRFGYDRPRGKSYLKLAFENPLAVPDQATHIEVTFFRKVNVATPTEPLSFSRRLIPLSGTGTYAPELFFLQEDRLTFQSLYFWYQRFVRVTDPTTAPQIVASHAPRIFGFTTQTVARSGSSLNYLLLLSGASSPTPILFDVEFVPGLFPGSISVGTVVEEKPIPDYPEDEEPILTELDP